MKEFRFANPDDIGALECRAIHDCLDSALPRNLARDGRRYAYGGSLIPWPGQVIAPHGFVSFSDPLNIGGFPSGQYAVYVQYLTTHDLQLIQEQVVYFQLP
jgi:hypothetical protein